MTTIKGKDPIYKTQAAIFGAFGDILERTGTGAFENIVMDIDEGILEYTAYGKKVRRVFDMTMTNDELLADTLQWLFGMLDAIANA